MGNELGRIDGNIGPQTRRAIGIWQAKNGLPPTTYLPREQLAFLVVRTNPTMEAVRAGYTADQARTTQPKKQVAQKVRTQRPVAQNPANNSRSFRNGASARPWCGGTILRRPRITTS
ncbi:peptidoglycan-binding domain-containing protein [Mesorhizobium sp. M0500]|uniref:peptidoglycan-binding domain-containing protein n=1 Tax=unclassified Mesorhizobium TaxID=325217 RepID=UPI00333C9953